MIRMYHLAFKLLLLSFLLGNTACGTSSDGGDIDDSHHSATPQETPSDTTEPSDSEELDDEAPSAAFATGPYGTSFRSTVGAFTVSTLAGEFDFQRQWTGDDSFFFVQYTNDTSQSEGLRNYLEALWFPARSSASAFSELLSASPRNVHYVFASFDGDAEVDVSRMRDGLEVAIASMSAEDQAHWRSRCHFVSDQIWRAEGWMGDVFREEGGLLWFAIDRQQKMRQIGMMSDILSDRPRLANLAYEAEYFNFEYEREQALAAESNVTELIVLAGESVGTRVLSVSFPPADEMAQFDTMQLDVGAYCDEHLDANCGEWDYLSDLMACDAPLVSQNPYGETSCQPRISALDAAAEVMGSCVDSETACREDGDCGQEGVCEGYTAAVDAVQGVEADAIVCTCESPLGEQSERAYVCNDEGTGYADCNCPCDTEMARWVTTYGREGRWVTDVSPFLAFFKSGGEHKMRLGSGNTYNFDFTVRLSNRSKGFEAFDVVELFGGGSFNADYNTGRETLQIEAPVGTRRVELVAYVTGHGWGAEAANCAEFCAHTHHFTLNGQEFVKRHDVAGSRDGCARQVGEGVVPNQFGTWPLGRAGWCPGQDVKPWVVDVSDAMSSGALTIDYRGLFNGVDYVPQPSGRSEGFGAQIRMNSYLVYYR